MRRMTLGLMLTAIAAGGAGAQPAPSGANWPDRPIHLIVPFPAGSSSDIVGRLVAQRLGDRLGQPVVVENRPGASGNVGTEAVAHADADGYTLGLANTSTHTVSPSLMSKQTYDPIKDFAPISMIGASPFVLALYPGLAVQSVPELIAAAKAKPAKLTFAEAGPATLANLAGLLFDKMANIELTPVSYRGSEQEVFDLIAGRVDMAFATIPPTLQLIHDGKVRALAVTGPRRSPTLPDIPTIAESGLPGYESVLWQAIYAPAATPAAIVTRISTEMNAILRERETIDALAKFGVDAEPTTPQELAARIKTDLDKWHGVIASAGIHAE
jgi:tripartite-type tricarboxylate transporter receptor subunit TctC